MDRFIATACVFIQVDREHLKSSMDRFIDDCYINYDFTIKEFKIKYG